MHGLLPWVKKSEKMEEVKEVYEVPYKSEGYCSNNGNVSNRSSRSYIPIARMGNGDRWFMPLEEACSYSGANGWNRKNFGEPAKFIPQIKVVEEKIYGTCGADYKTSGVRKAQEQALFTQSNQEQFWGSTKTWLRWTGEPLSNEIAEMFDGLYTPATGGNPVHEIQLGCSEWDTNSWSTGWTCSALKCFCQEKNWTEWSMSTWFKVFELAHKANFGEFLKTKIVASESYRNSLGQNRPTTYWSHDEKFWAIWSHCDHDPDTFKKFWKNRPTNSALAQIYTAAVAKHGYKAVKNALLKRKKLKEILNLPSAWMAVIHKQAEFIPLEMIGIAA